MTAALIGGATLFSAYSSYQQGQAQSSAYKAQARQAENDARGQLIERKRALVDTLAAQNVGAAAQGRTISSISAIQNEDVRRAEYDNTIITGTGAAKSQAYKNAASSASSQSYLNAGSSLLSGGTKISQL